MNDHSKYISEDDWQPVPRLAAITLAAFSAWFVWVHFFTTEQWVFLLDHANLALHEAGHPLLGILSSHLSVYGGTVFQIFFPALFIRHFSRRRHAVGLTASWVWLGESLMNVGRYMKDARAGQLPLVGGGDHDWTEIFSRWGVLASDVRIGDTVRLLGLCIVMYALVQMWKQRES
jgi:hypothetical protein